MRKPHPVNSDPFLEVAGQCAADWDYTAEISLIRDGVNHVFAATRRDGLALIIRVADGRHRSRERTLGELLWLQHLRSHGCVVTHPLESKAGELLVTRELNGEIYHVSCFERFRGRAVRLDVDWDEDFQRRLGETIGAVHRASDSLELPSELARYPWWEESEARFPEPLPEAFDHPQVVRNMRAHEAEFRKAGPRSQPDWGLIHRDTHSGNLLLENGRLELIDFDLGCLGWRVMDLAVPLYNHFMEPLLRIPGATTREASRFVELFIEGYRKFYQLDDHQLDRLSSCLKVREALIYNLLKPHVSHWEKALGVERARIEEYLKEIELHWRDPDFEFREFQFG